MFRLLGVIGSVLAAVVGAYSLYISTDNNNQIDLTFDNQIHLVPSIGADGLPSKPDGQILVHVANRGPNVARNVRLIIATRGPDPCSKIQEMDLTRAVIAVGEHLAGVFSSGGLASDDFYTKVTKLEYCILYDGALPFESFYSRGRVYSISLSEASTFGDENWAGRSDRSSVIEIGRTFFPKEVCHRPMTGDVDTSRSEKAVNEFHKGLFGPCTIVPRSSGGTTDWRSHWEPIRHPAPLPASTSLR